MTDAAGDGASRGLRVGQTLLYVPDGRGWSKPCEITITKVGRKWATFGHGMRVDMRSMAVDGSGYSSPGKCYLSAEDYEAEKAADVAWRELDRRLTYGSRQPGVTAAAIRQAAALLGIEIGAEDDGASRGRQDGDG